jgi:hypothetical protein
VAFTRTVKGSTDAKGVCWGVKGGCVKGSFSLTSIVFEVRILCSRCTQVLTLIFEWCLFFFVLFIKAMQAMEAVARAYKALLVAQYGAAYYVQMQEAWKENQYQRANAERVYLLAWYKAYFDQFEKIQDDDDPRLQEY